MNLDFPFQFSMLSRMAAIQLINMQIVHEVYNEIRKTLKII